MNLLVTKCFIVILTNPETGMHQYMTMNGNLSNSVFSSYVASRHIADAVLAKALKEHPEQNPTLHEGVINLDVQPVSD